jgi:hypothetical protein
MGPQGPQGLKGDIGPTGPKGETVWSNLNTTEKEEIMAKLKTYAELKGPKGDTGPQGLPGDPTEVAKLASLNNAFMQTLGTNIVANATTLSENVAKALTDDTVRRNTLVDAVHVKPVFQDAIADKLSSNATYRARIKGDPGDAANPESLRLALTDKTLWCADGDFCKLPANKTFSQPSSIFITDENRTDWKNFKRGLHIKNTDGRWTHIEDGNAFFRSNLQVDGNTLLNGNDVNGIMNPNGSTKINQHGIMFGGANNGKEVNSAQISAGVHVPNSLNIVGMSSGKEWKDRRVDIWAEGGLYLHLGGTPWRLFEYDGHLFIQKPHNNHPSKRTEFVLTVDNGKDENHNKWIHWNWR